MQRAWAAFCLLVFAVVLLRTSWTCDDAYITFRTIDNAIHGLGLRWNPAERVQAFTHPAWLFLLLPFVAWTGEVYYTVQAVSAGIALGTLAVLLLNARSLGASVLVGIAALGSMAYVDFSTSGLENPLTHALLAAFVLLMAHVPRSAETPERWSLAIVLVATVAVLNRIDLAVLVGPAVLYRLYPYPWRTALRLALIGGSPFAAWELFSLVYYGSLVPNTAIAKLGAGIPASNFLYTGTLYLRNSVRWDPVTLPTAAICVLVALRRGGVERVLAVCMLLHVAYVVRVGGDHMSGRFLTPPFALALAMLSTWEVRAPVAVVGTLGLVVAGANALIPPLTSGPDALHLGLDRHVAHERGFFYRLSGLLRPEKDRPTHETLNTMRAKRDVEEGKKVDVRGMIGWYGYAAGPQIHVIDVLALTDPLLARLPTRDGRWRVGHYARDLPEGYEQAAIGEGRLADRELAAYYDDLQLVTRGPLFAPERWRAMARLAWSGDATIDAYCRRRCSIHNPPFLSGAGPSRNRTLDVHPHGIALRRAKGKAPWGIEIVGEPMPMQLEVRRVDHTNAVIDVEPGPVGGQEGWATTTVQLPTNVLPYTSVRLFAPGMELHSMKWLPREPQR
ncbi:MAG: hypothetical protein H6736_11840 [Alphaproteobacteria bacterium]|nr:hypothetical protein [Alphaproteobacteria bacterium]MCB9692495.1 hypothetical protein [Alphaproteobacteria bacterium]